MSAKKSTSERILETADRLFYGQGTAVGVDTLAAEAGVSKRTLYNHYPSKDALIEAYLTRRIRLIPTSDKPPAQQISKEPLGVSPPPPEAKAKEAKLEPKPEPQPEPKPEPKQEAAVAQPAEPTPPPEQPLEKVLRS